MWSDRETLQDCLGFTRYVESLTSVCTAREIAPVAMGVFGSWGSGKTSLMRMMEKALEDAPRVRTVWFNAWQYDGKEELQSALIAAILARVEEGKTLGQQATDLLKRLKDSASVLRLAKVIGRTALTLTPDIGGLVDCFREETDKVTQSVASFEADFVAFLKQMDLERVVVFIDDLDRCQSKQVIEAFETIKLFLSVPECTFVLGADDDKIRRAVVDTYSVSSASQPSYADDYLEKIIQIPFRIPAQRLEDIQCYMTMLLLKRRLAEDGWAELVAVRGSVMQAEAGFHEWVRAHPSYFGDAASEALAEVDRVAPHARILAMGLRGNPRQIKRFLNILELRRRLAKANDLEIDDARLIKLLVVEYTWRDFFDNVVETVSPETGTSDLLTRTAACDTEAAQESPMLATALDTVGLVDFLQAEPVLGESVDLAPYMFLAQTALSASRRPELSDADARARDLADKLCSADRLRSRAVAAVIRREEIGFVGAVVRLVAQRFASLAGAERVHVVSNLTEICKAHPQHFEAVTDMLAGVAGDKSQGLALVASSFLDAAAASGVTEAVKVKALFGSPFPKAGAARSGKPK